MKPSRSSSVQAVSMIEVLAVIAVVGVLCALAVVAAHRTNDSSALTKLQTDVSTINSAIKVYQANGGSLTGLTKPQDVLDKLKTQRAGDEAGKYAGLRLSMLDRRVQARTQTTQESASRAPRAVWNAAKNCFEVKTAGEGVAEFKLDDSLASVDYGTEDREMTNVPYNLANGWIWEYLDSPSDGGPAPTDVELHEPAGTSSSSSGGSGSTGTSASGGSSGTSGTAGGSTSGESGSTGSATSGSSGDTGGTTGGSTTSSSGSSSGTTGSSTGGTSNPMATTQLLPPLFSINETSLPWTSFPLAVVLTNPNASAVSQVQYSVQGGPWKTYSGPVSVPANAMLQAKAISTSPLYTDSVVVDKFYQPVLGQISGTGAASFSGPKGPRGMVQSVSAITNGSYFTWGVSSYMDRGRLITVGRPNTLTATGLSFANVAMGQRFKVGKLDYYNGTILSGTEAETVELTMKLNITSPEVTALTFKFTFDLENTPNNGKKPWDDADYVRIQARGGASVETIHGVRYQIELAFGNTSSSGFATVSEFHVLEDAGASAELYATITPVLGQ